MGQPAPTATSAAEFALRFNALLIPYFGVRAKDGFNFHITLGAPITHSEPLQMTTDITALLEDQIAAHPEQWFWVHNRWKPERTPARSAQPRRRHNQARPGLLHDNHGGVVPKQLHVDG